MSSTRDPIVRYLLRRADDHDRIAIQHDDIGNVLAADGCRQIAYALRIEAMAIVNGDHLVAIARCEDV